MKLLYEDRDLVIAEKPSSVLSEPDGSGQDIQTVLREQLHTELFPVHRLDRGTGGAMMLAKSARAAERLSAQIAAREVHKIYWAAVAGTPDESGALTDLLYRDARRNKTFVVDRMRKGVKEARLTYRLAESAETEQGPISLVRVHLETGRTHQVRVQFGSRGWPLLGDGKYGSRIRCELALWSTELSLNHPFTHAPITVHSAPPAEFPWSCFSAAAWTRSE